MSVSPNTEIILKTVLKKSKNLPGILKIALQAMICDEIVFWASACYRALKYMLNESKTLPGSVKIALQTIICDEISSLGINVMKYIAIVLKNVINVSKNPQVH